MYVITIMIRWYSTGWYT